MPSRPGIREDILAERGDTNAHRSARINPWIKVHTVAVDEVVQTILLQELDLIRKALAGRPEP
jgi:hypothetical protein